MPINDWMQGDGSDALIGSTNAFLIDDNVTAYIQDPLDLLLSEYQQGCGFSIASVTTVSIAPGQIVNSNSGGTARRFRKNAAAITLDISTSGVGGLDTGTVAANTVYYVYTTADTSDTAFNGVFSLSSSSPTGVTYFRRLGYVRTNASSQITTKGSFFASGAIAQIVMTTDRVARSSSAPIFAQDNSVPQITGGGAYAELDTPFIPSSATSNLLITVNLQMVAPVATGTGANAFLFVDSGPGAIAGGEYYTQTSAVNANATISFEILVPAASVTERTYKVRVGFRNSSGFLNSNANGLTWGNTVGSTLKIIELR